MAPECLLQHSQHLATCPHPVPEPSSPWNPTHFSLINFGIVLPSTPRSFPQIFPSKSCMYLSHFPYAQHAPPSPVARSFQVGAMAPLQIWMHSLRIFEISNSNMTISPLKVAWHVTAFKCCLCWTAVVWSNPFSKNVLIWGIFCTMLYSALCN